MRRAVLVLVVALAGVSAAGQAPAPAIADAIYVNGHILTMWPDHPAVQAVAVRGDRFVAAGTNAEIQQLAGASTRRVDLQGRTVLPGLIDSHTHPITAALSQRDGIVPVMKSIPDILTYIRQLAVTTPPGRVIFVPKIYSTRLNEHRYPTRYELDEAAPTRPAMTDNGYGSVLNSAALRSLGITRDTPQPANGKIIKDDKGEPTGLILGAAQLLGELRRQRAPTHDDMAWALTEMQKRYSEVGITSTTDRSEGADGLRIYQEFKARGGLSVRTTITYVIGGQGTPEQVTQEIERLPIVTGMGDEWVRIGPLKTFVDGGILIGTALLREPYGEHTDIYGYKDPGYQGVLSLPRENLTAMARAANRLGWQMTAHVTGGGALDALLDAYESANRDSAIAPRRFSLTHANFPNARAIQRAKAMAVSFDSQPAWLHLDGAVIKDVFGDRMGDFLPLRSIFDAGVLVAGGSDHMVGFDSRNAINPFNPFFGMWMAITRKTVDGSVLGADQTITREQALRMWTVNGAWLTFDEKTKGSIEPGKLADFVVISKDVLTCPVDEIKDIDALMTVVGGNTVHKNTTVP